MTEKQQLVRAVVFQGREMSARILLFHQSIAARFGLNPTDHKCLDLAREQSDVTAGRLADLTGLTTGAITAALDRLEAAGFIRRLRDPGDRRLVRVRVLHQGIKKLARAFEEFKSRMTDVNESFTAAELQIIFQYQAKCIDALVSLTRKPQQKRKRPHA
jgi:DNA-binding MarR family transcriptional regulator